MAAKIQSEITKITLNGATFKNTGAFFEPTFINFLFGNNGTGKSTIAKAIESGTGVSYPPGKGPDDYNVLLYDQDYIDASMRNYHNLPGVFTINSQNVTIQEQIDKKSEEKEVAKKAATDAMALVESKTAEKDELEKQFFKTCWDKSEKLREQFDKTQDGKRKSKQFTEEVRKHEPVEHDIDELKRTYSSVYLNPGKKYERFSEIEDSSALDSLVDSEFLSMAIVNTSNTPFAKFLEKVGSTQWMRQGHAAFHEAADGHCPYCSQELPDNFDEILKTSFDTEYEDNIQKLNTLMTGYRNKANSLVLSLQNMPEEIYPEVKTDSYQDKVGSLKGIIAGNIEKIQSKINNPALSIILDSTKETFEDLADLIKTFNTLIDENNAIVDAGSQKEFECKKHVFEYMAFQLSDTINRYETDDKKIDSEIEAQETIANTQDELQKNLDTEIKNLSSQTVETETAMNNINALLKDAGFQGFEVRPLRDEISGKVRNYEVVRVETGKVVDRLSEGEKNFIAFLYFLQTVIGSVEEDGDTREKIVVIDDPVSSMDSKALFIVSTQVRKMIEICKNRADSRGQIVPGNFISQIFILTHNAYFHREVSYSYVERYQYVSFFHVKKLDNKSSVTLCVRPDPEEPSENINVNPVKNTYAALWQEYKELNSGIALVNVMRRILEYYFLQLCGYDGGSLRTVILEDKKYEFTHDENGNEDLSKYDMASAMLSYIAVSSSPLNDGMTYTSDFDDGDQCKATFEMIFREMGQERHYEMMMSLA